MIDNALNQEMRSAGMDPTAQAARQELCRALCIGFKLLGHSLQVHGHFVGSQRRDGTSPFGNGDDRLVAMGHLSQTAANLIDGAVILVLAGNNYASSALNRQLVEVEYLAWAFCEDSDEASKWLRSSQQERLKRWQPRHLRARSQGRFRGADYGDHCEMGGHPTPDGMRHLSSADLLLPQLLLSETASHGASTWDYLLLAAVALCLHLDLEPTDVVPDTFAKAVGTAEGRWREVERLGLTWQGRQHPPGH